MPCALNTYSEKAGADKCTPCCAGSYSGLGESKCHTCCAGQYFDPALYECVDCMASYYTPNAGEVCKKCPCKMWSQAKESSCHECACGTVINADQTGCDPIEPPGEEICLLGQEKDSDGYCVDCYPGTYNDLSTGMCKPCPDNMYQPSSGSPLCLPCYGGKVDPDKRVCVIEDA